MRYSGVLLSLLLVSPAAAAPAAEKPKLVVQLTFDQLRADLLERYRPALTGGLKRIMDGGWRVRRGEVAHGLTNSFPGHAGLATGLHPSRHGLTANEWWMERDGAWRSTSVVADERYTVLGDPDRPGYSPRYLQGTALADWVEAADPEAKTVALSSGGTVAMAYGGRRPDALYWYDGQSGEFITSAYYGAQKHAWLDAFNRSALARYKLPAWTLSVPKPFRELARPDASPHENRGRNTTFPHDYASESQAEAGGEPTNYGRWFAGTPLKDEALFSLAAIAVDQEKLGQGPATDYLAIAADATDAVGHSYGPFSLEQLDALLRLDRALGSFLDHLDRKIGRDRYVLALGADHGVANLPEEHGTRRITAAEIDALLDEVEAVAEACNCPRAELIDRIVAVLKGSDFVADAYSEDRLRAPSDDPFVELYSRSFRPGLTADFPLWGRKPVRPHHPARYGIIVRFDEGVIFDWGTAVHGSPYAYDRSVPIIFYGAGILAEQLASGARTIDVAPTLAALAQIPVPPGLDGKVLPVRRKGQGRPD